LLFFFFDTQIRFDIKCTYLPYLLLWVVEVRVVVCFFFEGVKERGGVARKRSRFVVVVVMRQRCGSFL